jgi:hypothetical protein
MRPPWMLPLRFLTHGLTVCFKAGKHACSRVDNLELVDHRIPMIGSILQYGTSANAETGTRIGGYKAKQSIHD